MSSSCKNSSTPSHVLGVLASLLILSLGVTAESLEGQGVITGAAEDSRTGQPLTAVQISIGNLGIGALSQANGSYQLPNVPAGTHTLTAQRIGYQSVNVQVSIAAGQTAVADFSLVQVALQLDELIVTGTAGGTQRRAIGNVVERMDVVAITDYAPVVSVEQLLSTRVPGLSMQPAGGMTGAGGAQIRIRGSSSIGLPNDPLVYIDGVRVNVDRAEARRQTTSRLNDINPEDIASIEVIKGPAAATLYGTEASNGVIQIITKRGVAGDVAFDATVGLGLNFLIDPIEKAQTNYTVRDGNLLSMNMVEAYKARNGEDLFVSGLVQEYSLSARGGTDQIRYFASFNRNDQNGIVDWNWDLRQTGRMNLDITANDKVSIQVSGSMMSGETRFAAEIWRNTMAGSPITAVDYGGFENPLMGYARQTPTEFRDGQEWLFDVERKNAALTLQFAPWPWFQNRLVGGVDLTDQVETNTIFREANAPNGLWGTSGLGRRDYDRLETQLQTLDYAGTVTYDVTDRLQTATSFGFQYYEKKTVLNTARGDEFATEFLSTIGAAARTRSGEDRLENVTVGLYVQEQFSWEDRIFLTGAVRFDENSAFGVDFGTQIYPKVSGTWVLSEESFWNVDFLSPLRVRGAWGAAGRQPDVFAAQRLYSPETGTGNTPVVTPQNIGNSLLGPERGEEIEIGFDAGFFNERVEVALTQYWKSTKDAIVDRPALPSSGFPGRQFVNAGQVDNWGTELSVDFQILQQDPLRWDLIIAAATMDNKIISLGDIDRILIRRGFEHVVGYGLGGLHSIKVVEADFLPGESPSDPGRNNVDIDNALCDGGIAVGGGHVQGGPAVACDDAPRVYWGNSHHTWQINATSTWTLFGDLRVFATLEGRGGGTLQAERMGARHISWQNSFSINTRTDPILLAQVNTDRDATGYLPNGYLNFEEVGVQYQLPSEWAGRMGARRASLGLSIRNLGFIWREACCTLVGNENVVDVRQSKGDAEFWGQQDTQAPITSTGILRMRISF